MKNKYYKADKYVAQDCDSLYHAVKKAISDWQNSLPEKDVREATEHCIPIVFTQMLADHFDWHFYRGRKKDIEMFTKYVKSVFVDTCSENQEIEAQA